MLEVLQRHIEAEPQSCVVAKWISTLDTEEQDAFQKIKENNQTISLASLLADLQKHTQLPFKLTAFRSHFRGYCTCQH